MEATTADAYVYAQLTADATLSALGVYNDGIPSGVSYPLVHFYAIVPGIERAAIGDNTILVNRHYLVYAIAEFRDPEIRAGYQPIQDYAERIHTQLHQASGTVTGEGEVFRSYRTELHQRRVVVDGIEYRELGGRYVVLVQDS